MYLEKLTNPRWWRFMAQRRVTDVDVRNARADRVAAKQPRSPGDEEAGRILARDGYLMLPKAPAAQVEAMRGYFEQELAFDPYRRHLGLFHPLEQAPPETHVANFPDEVVARAPHALETANAPEVLAVVSAMLGCKPTISSLAAWWSLPAKTPAEHAELWHRDVDDYRFVKLFFYLTDVDEEAGPHGFIKGSHRVNKLTTTGRRVPDEEVMKVMGAENLVRFTGPAGTRFLENTYGLHRGFPVKSQPRLIYQVFYAHRPSVYSPASSVGLSGPYDPWINRLYM